MKVSLTVLELALYWLCPGPNACHEKEDANNHTVSASKKSLPADPNQIAIMKQSCAYMNLSYCGIM